MSLVEWVPGLCILGPGKPRADFWHRVQPGGGFNLGRGSETGCLKGQENSLERGALGLAGARSVNLNLGLSVECWVRLDRGALM